MQYWRERKIKLITLNELQKMCLSCLYPHWRKLIPVEAGTLKSYHIFFSLILPPDFAIVKYTELLNAILRESKHKNLFLALRELGLLVTRKGLLETRDIFKLPEAIML